MHFQDSISHLCSFNTDFGLSPKWLQEKSHVGVLKKIKKTKYHQIESSIPPKYKQRHKEDKWRQSKNCFTASRDQTPPKLDCCQLVNPIYCSRITSSNWTKPVQPSPVNYHPTFKLTHTHPCSTLCTHTHWTAADWQRNVFIMTVRCKVSLFWPQSLGWCSIKLHESEDMSWSLQTETMSCRN